MPFACGAEWNGKTYRGHDPSEYSLDFNMRGTSGDQDKGEPVHASAAGTVRRRQTDLSESYGRYIIIDHGNGWSTLYAHLASFAVADGARVSQGQLIGTVGDSGGPTYAHLHYEQRLNGADRPVYFDGAPLDPGYYYGSGNGPVYVSRNCPAPADRGISGVVRLRSDGSSSGLETLFMRSNQSGRLLLRNHRADGWRGWRNPSALSTRISSGPDATTRKAGHFDVVARGTDGRVMLAYKTPGGGWHDFRPFSDFSTPYAPSIVALNQNHIFVFAVRSGDGALMARRWIAGQGWDVWYRVMGSDGPRNFTSGPDATVKAGERALAVAVRGASGYVRVIHWRAGAFRSNQSWGFPQARVKAGVAPAIASRFNGSLDVLVASPTGSVHRRTVTNGRVTSDWHAPTNLNRSTINQGPDIVAHTRTGALTLYARNNNGIPVIANWNRYWTTPTRIG